MLKDMAYHYAQEKQYWLEQFQQLENIPYIKFHRALRDQAVKAGYRSPYQLQARMWKLALQDAAELMDRYWQNLFDEIKRDIRKSQLNPSQQHYAYWLMKDYRQFVSVLKNKALLFNDMSYRLRMQVIYFLNRRIKRYQGRLPHVRLARSILFDADCYKVFWHQGRQYIKVMTLIPYKRICLPLLGETSINGNICLVLNNNSIAVHCTHDIKIAESCDKPEKIVAIDVGYSEVFVDNEGHHYSNAFGLKLKEASDKLKEKMQKRNKLHALEKRYFNENKKQKASKIKNNNLGKVKLNYTKTKAQATLKKEINTAFNELCKKQPTLLISEQLSRAFHFKYDKNTNRRLSHWTRGVLNDRLKFKALAKGFSHITVNPAYTSQLCPECDYVDERNRQGDKFVCQHCRWVGDADWVAAINLLRRYDDPEITRYMSYREVKRILERRFHRRLEANMVTVSGRTREPHYLDSHKGGQSESNYLNS